MPEALIRFYEELNDFLPEGKRKVFYPVEFFDGETVKSVIENQGVPHTEIDLITVNSLSVPFSYAVRPEDRICVYPVFEAFDIAPVSLVRPEPLRKVRFILDVHLGKLAKRLRMLGFDSVWEQPFDDPSLARRASREGRILLTRDRGLLKRKIVSHGYCIRSSDPDRQTEEVIERFDLSRLIRPFTRCMECNNPLEDRSKDEVMSRLPPKVRNLTSFKECPSCGNLYWKGTHWEHMMKKIKKFLTQDSSSTEGC